jgi:SAM-dependent methyltransferase
MQVGDYVALWRLANSRLRSEEDYRQFQVFQAALLLSHLRAFGVDVKGARVLDIGSGVGGYSVEMIAQGARVISLDLIRSSHQAGGQHILLTANALAIPLHDESMDFVFCASLIEHVPDPARLLTEIERTLVPGGYLYLSFPPFYSPRGGHEFAPFHYLGERLAIRLVSQEQRHPEWVRDLFEVSLKPNSFAETYRGWGLYKMTIAKARRLLASSGFELVNMSTRYLPFSAIRWPGVGEVLTWHAQFLLRKPAASHQVTQRPGLP